MPGILNRTAFFGKLPNGTLRRLDFNLVNTDLGAMVEPNQSIRGLTNGIITSVVGDTAADGLSDNAVNEIQYVKEDEMYELLLTSGLQSPPLW